MARARIEAQKASANAPTPDKPTVEKPRGGDTSQQQQQKPTYQQNRDKLRASRQQQRQQQGGQQAAQKKPGFLQRVGNRLNQVKQGVSDTVAGAKRVAGGVADAATGNRFDFDKRGGQKTLMGKPINNQGGGQQQQQSGGGQRRPMSPEMQRRVAQTQVGTNAAKAVQKINPKPGQTVTTQTTPKGTTATLTSSAGSLQKNKQKANRVANAMNQQGGNVSVGKIDDF